MRAHFENQDALTHVVKKRAEGKAHETHATELPSHLSAAFDAAREMSVVLFLAWIFLKDLDGSFFSQGILLLALGMGWLTWKTGRTAWVAWARLERLHLVIEQEKYEIEHNREQEREELTALYQSKGFQGKLLEEVVDVLMANEQRLLKVMLEEELGLTLEAYQHPLKQCMGACAGSFFALLLSNAAFFLIPSFGMPLASLLLISVSAFCSASYEKNRLVPALIWNLSIASLAAGVSYIVFQIFRAI